MMGPAKSDIASFSLFDLKIIFPKLNSVSIICVIQFDAFVSLFISLKQIFIAFITSPVLAPSSGLKSQLIFITGLYKR